MTVTESPADSVGAGTCRLRYDVLERRLEELGATNDSQRAEILGVVRQTIVRWRGGRTGVAMGTAARVAQVLGVRLDRLVELAPTTPPGTPPPSPPPPQPPRPSGPPSRGDH